MKALVGAFNQEKAIVGAFSVIVQPVVEPMDRFTALEYCHISPPLPPAVSGVASVCECAALRPEKLVTSVGSWH